MDRRPQNFALQSSLRIYITCMIANHIHDALGQVRRLQELVLDRHMFRGYSGKARLACGAMTLLAAMAMS